MKKRTGTIALSAVPAMYEAAGTLDKEGQEIFFRNVNRWLDNGHNLDADDIVWLTGEAAQAVEGRRAARLLEAPELPVITITETDDGLWQSFHSDRTGDADLWRFPTLESAISSSRSFLLREYAPR